MCIHLQVTLSLQSLPCFLFATVFFFQFCAAETHQSCSSSALWWLPIKSSHRLLLGVNIVSSWRKNYIFCICFNGFFLSLIIWPRIKQCGGAIMVRRCQFDLLSWRSICSWLHLLVLSVCEQDTVASVLFHYSLTLAKTVYKIDFVPSLSIPK